MSVDKEQCDKNHDDLKEDIGEIKIDIKEIKSLITDLRIDNALLKFKSSMWGALSGALIYAAIYVVEKLKS